MLLKYFFIVKENGPVCALPRIATPDAGNKMLLRKQFQIGERIDDKAMKQQSRFQVLKTLNKIKFNFGQKLNRKKLFFLVL